ncbi:hypothetical protein UFOVP4_5 [uncultured Caudovirales phage]|uniref:Uncharacterized protein n=1 Tax=uncultured Caudovirales phage TaxID=2100421 RepID=A0A6J5TAX6_9CAUD|nr:hypothetical protein UFOVP4_5 [uncultured Caudovirales phage]CAB4241354.1 hypothetical protein UFOVP64_54 [uncultured Caudovirales phage]CAB5078969.1 hypothetical protein UFOVP145_10 [uncultured Caudovirales phage]
MCFGGGDNGASEIAAAQRRDEQARQARIKAGMARIADIFDGAPTGTSETYNMDDTGDERMKSFFGNFGRMNADTTYTGPRTGGFNEDFYNKRKQAYVDYATPQLDRQYGNAKDQTVYALDRSGLLSSSAGIKKNADLTDTFDQARIGIANKGLDVANQARSDVEAARSNLVNQLNATGDDQAAAAGAVRNAAALNAPQGMSPVGQLFSDFTNTLAGIGSNARNDYSGLSGNIRSLFNSGGSGGSARVVG